ncbi:MAG: TIM barrel protein [Clostridia bacterium]|nr:TIM barrel protein [Clostridia bacterium]
MIKFGVAGNSKSFYDEGYTQTLEAGKWCKDRGIDVFEYSFGRGITLNEKTAVAIGNRFKEEGVELTVHAPYYINLANPDPEMIQKSYGYILSSLKKVKDFGGNRVVVHPATQGKMVREDAVKLMLENAKGLVDVLDREGYLDGYKVCFETMGKMAQLGTPDEIIAVCNLDARFYPCVDFGHINAREQGILKNATNYNTLIQKMEDFLPKHKVFDMHVHFSKIEYGAKGEIRHLTFADDKYGPDFEPLMQIFHDKGMSPYVISESDGTQAEDTITMKKYFFSL